MSTGAASARVVGAVASEPRVMASFGVGDEPEMATDFWSLLANARTSEQLCRAWLGILCQWIPGTQAGLLLLHDQGDSYAPAAVWPDPERDMAFMAGIAQQALVERRGAMQDEGDGLAQWAYPLLGAQQSYGVVVLHVVVRGDAAMREALRLLHWGAGWLTGLFDRRQLLEREHKLGRSGLLQDLLLGVMNEAEADDAARWVVNRLAQALPSRSVMLARADNRQIELVSVSGSAGFDQRSNLLTVAREAMREAVLLGEAQCFPTPGSTHEAPLLAASSLADYCREAGAAAVMVLPLQHQGQTDAALLLAFDTPPTTELYDFVQTAALALAPGLALHRLARRNLASHAHSAWVDARATLLGPRHAGMKLAGLSLAVALALAALVPVQHRVSAPATIEGRVQRAAVAPFGGFVQEAKARAGDAVKQGDVLARLDDRELKLEDLKWTAQAELTERKLREAMARADAVAVRLAQAEHQQTQAELALVRERLARTSIVAPFDGVVVKGDLSQQLGAPVEQGKVLFEIAPLDSYRVVLKVDERDITRLRSERAGELVLSGLAGEHFDLRVARIAPVATTENGVNAFRVEAALDASPAQLARIQPGMEGVAKVEAGEHSLLWVGLHRFIDGARYTLWSLGL
ncbi:MAG: efflux RND transporter periplasmic adaptor subunit [Burkholderiaceae bacterium]|nr:efflux RND transporter periplasmic adaptor subunit [Burkholderiaceae bacterium]